MSIIENIIDIPIEHERNVCGELDIYLKKIERTLKVTLIERNGEIKLIGPESSVEKTRSIFNTLIELSKRGNRITEQNVDYAISLSFTEGEDKLLEIRSKGICRFNQKKNDSIWSRSGRNRKNISCYGYGYTSI